MAARVQAAVEVVKNKALKVAEDTKAYAKEKTSQVTLRRSSWQLSFFLFIFGLLVFYFLDWDFMVLAYV